LAQAGKRIRLMTPGRKGQKLVSEGKSDGTASEEAVAKRVGERWFKKRREHLGRTDPM